MQDFFETFFSYFFTLFFNVSQCFQGFADCRVVHAGWRFQFRQNGSIYCGFSRPSGTIYRGFVVFYFLPQCSAASFVIPPNLHLVCAGGHCHQAITAGKRK